MRSFWQRRRRPYNPAPMPADQRIDALLADYNSHHRTRENRVCHAFGITLIVFGVLSLLLPIHVGPLTAAELAIAALVVPSAILEIRLGSTLLLAAIALDLLARAAGDARVGLVAFILGWGLQAIGHAVYEKNKPAFFRNLVHLVVGPLYLLNKLLKIRPIPSGNAGNGP